MKPILYSFIIGVLLGGGIIYYLLNKATPTLATMNITSSNNANITDEQIIIKQKRKVVTAITSFNTDKEGRYTNTITINRQQLQYNNSIYGNLGYLITSETLLLDIGYSYKRFLMSAKIGYSFELSSIEYGLGIGGKFSW